MDACIDISKTPFKTPHDHIRSKLIQNKKFHILIFFYSMLTSLYFYAWILGCVDHKESTS